MKKKRNKAARRKIIISFIVFNLAFLFLNSTLYAKDKFYWFNVGIGRSSLKGYAENSFTSNQYAYYSFCANFSYQTGWKLISAHCILNQELHQGKFLHESLWDVGLLFGGSLKTSHALASLSGGVSFIGGVRRGKWTEHITRTYYRGVWWRWYDTGAYWETKYRISYEKLTFSTIGFSMEIQLLWKFSHSMGIGLYGYANVNSENSYAGILLCTQIGKLRKKVRISDYK